MNAATLKSWVKNNLPLRVLNEFRVRSALRSGEPELRLVPIFCDKRHAMIDVGANVGIYTHYARRFAKTVYACEPLPALAGAIRSTYGGGNVTVIEAGMSDAPGRATLHVPVSKDRTIDTRASLLPGLSQLTETAVDVEISTVDARRIEDVSLIKIDVEGFETEVLRGAAETLRRYAPAVIVEAEERMRANAVPMVTEILTGHGYTGFFIHHGKLLGMDQFQPGVHQDPNAFIRIGEKRHEDYINNFVFVHAPTAATLDRMRAAAGV